MEKNEIKWIQDTWDFDVYGEEMPLIKAVRTFFDSFSGKKYDYRKVMSNMGNEALGLLLIHVMDEYGNIDYGTSLRFGWTTEKGEHLRMILQHYTDEKIYDAIHTELYMEDEENESEC